MLKAFLTKVIESKGRLSPSAKFKGGSSYTLDFSARSKSVFVDILLFFDSIAFAQNDKGYKLLK